MPVLHRGRLRPGGDCSPGPNEARPRNLDEMALGGRASLGAPIRIARARHRRSRCAGRRRDRDRGIDRSRICLEPRKARSAKATAHVALEDFNMSMQVTAITRKRAPVFVSIVSQVTPSEIERAQEGRL